MNLFAVFLISMLMTSPVRAKEYVDWKCQAHTKLTIEHEFKICSDYTECEMDAHRLGSKVSAIKDGEGNIAYGIFYEVVLASSELIDSDSCK